MNLLNHYLITSCIILNLSFKYNHYKQINQRTIKKQLNNYLLNINKIIKITMKVMIRFMMEIKIIMLLVEEIVVKFILIIKILMI